MIENNERIKREVLLEGLLSNYGKERFLNWCKSLNFFRFCKSHPYPDDLKPDRFIALTNFGNIDELIDLSDVLELEFREEKESSRFLENIETTFSGKATVFGISCYVDVNKVMKTVLLEVSGNERDQFSLDDTTFQRAKMIDRKLANLEIEFISSPYEDDYCVTPEFYPEIWR